MAYIILKFNITYTSFKIIILIYECFSNKNLKLRTLMKLPNVSECQPIVAMPNKVSPSDHLPLFARFSYQIK